MPMGPSPSIVPDVKAPGKRPTRRIILCGITTVVALAICAITLRSRLPPEPAYQGRTLSEWLVDLDYSLRPPHQVASNAVHQMGTNVLPHLGPMLRAHDSVLKLKLVDLAKKQTLVKINFVPANEKRRRASSACRVLGPAAAAYVPELVAMLDSTNHITAWCGFVAVLDVKRREDSVPELTKALTNSYTPIRRFASSELARLLLRQPAQLIPLLLGMLHDPDVGVRTEAASHLSVLVSVLARNEAGKRELARHKQQLVGLAGHSDQEIRKRAIELVSSLPTALVWDPQFIDDERAVLLSAFLNDPAAEIRLAVAYKLGALARDNARARSMLTQYLLDRDLRVRSVAESFLDPRESASPYPRLFR
jgi:hypothetical protein